MRTLILEAEYSINLAGSYFVDTPILKEDWLCICLYYDQVMSILKHSDKFNQDLIKFIDYPFLELLKQNYTGGQPFEIGEAMFNTIRYSTENNFHFLPNLEKVNRDNLLDSVNKHLPKSIELLKKSFLTFDLLKYFITKNIPTLGGKLSSDLEAKLIDFKKSALGQAFINGINDTIDKYSTYYYLTPELEIQLKNEFIEIQQEFLAKLNFEKIKSFKFSSLIEDGVGTAASFIIPFLPMGTIKELFNFAKNQIDFKRNKELQFILSLFYLQKILQQEIKETTNINYCVICQTTIAEIKNLKDEDTDNFIFNNTKTMCLKHLTGYLTARKFGQLTGKPLLLALKSQDY